MKRLETVENKEFEKYTRVFWLPIQTWVKNRISKAKRLASNKRKERREVRRQTRSIIKIEANKTHIKKNSQIKNLQTTSLI